MTREETYARFEELDRRASQGGGAAKIEKQHAAGHMTARERIDALLDKGTFCETDKLVNHRCTRFGMEKKQFPYMLCVTNMLLHDIDDPKVYHGNSLAKKLLDYTDKDKFDCILMNPPYGGSEKNDVKSYFPDNLASSETADLFMAVIMYRLKENGKAAVVLPDGFLFGNDNAKVNLKKKLLNDFNLHTIIRMPGSVFSPYTSIATNILFFDNRPSEGKVWFYRMDMPDGVKHFNKTRRIQANPSASRQKNW